MAQKKAKAPQQRKYSTIITRCPKCNSSINVTDQLQDYLADNGYEGLYGKPVEIEFLWLPLECPTCVEAGMTLCLAEDDFYDDCSIGEGTTANPLEDTQKTRHKKPKQAD